MMGLVYFVFAVIRRAGPSDRGAMKKQADEDLMRAYQKGEAAAFEVLLLRHERGVLNFVYRKVRDRDRAEELTQEVFLRVVRTAARYEPRAKFTTWLYTIARNLCIDESRKARRRRTVSLDETIGDDGEGSSRVERIIDTEAASGAGEIARSQFMEVLSEGLDALPEEQREVFILRHVEGMKFVDIAKVQDVSENTVKSRMRYAMAVLRGFVSEFEGYSFDVADRDEVSDHDAKRQV